jgi:flagellar basal-body rod protein FlgC
MSFDSILEISRLALGNEKLRAGIAAINIARVNTPLSAGQVKGVEFADALEGVSTNTAATGIQQGNVGINGEAGANPAVNSKLVYDPANTLAHDSGFVAYPDIDLATMFVMLTLAKRAYEANVRVFNTVAGMHNKTLELGRV